MPPMSSLEQRQVAKRQLIEHIERGASVQQARSHSAIPMHRATVYRLLKRVRAEGETAYRDERHGHPIKVRGEVRALLIEGCQATPSISSPVMQRAIQARFGLSISVSQLNRVRVSLGLSRKVSPREKKRHQFPDRVNPSGKRGPEAYCCWQPPPRPGSSPNSATPSQPHARQDVLPWPPVQRRCAKGSSSLCSFWELWECLVPGSCAAIRRMV